MFKLDSRFLFLSLAYLSGILTGEVLSMLTAGANLTAAIASACAALIIIFIRR